MTVQRNPKSNWDVENGYHGNLSKSVYPFNAHAGTNLFDAMNEMYKFNLFTTFGAEFEFCNQPLKGFRIAIHAVDEFPRRLRHFIQLRPQQAYFIKIKPKMIKTSNSLRIYSPHSRGCLFKDERKLRFFKSYSQWG